MSFRDRLRDIAGEAESEVLRLFDRYDGGGLTRSEFERSVAAALAQANGRSVELADRAAAVQLTRLFNREVEPEGVDRDLDRDRERLTESVADLLDAEPEVVAAGAVGLAASQRKRLARLARNEPLQRGQETVQRRFQRREVGWTRRVGADACPLCNDWDDGRVRPASIDMPRHVNCSCVQAPQRL